MATRGKPFDFNGSTIRAGKRRRVEVELGSWPGGPVVVMPVTVVHGKKHGPTLWVNAALHGDEINGVQIVRDVLSRVRAVRLRGTLIAVPIVNVFGFMSESRYLPDRRDLNRSFPGTSSGSVASRLAKLFMTQVVSRCDYGIDLHTGSDHRFNHPHTRVDMRYTEARGMALAFVAPIALHSKNRTGSLRRAAQRLGKPTIVYEAGEPLRFNKDAISTGVEGVMRVMAHLDMYDYDGSELAAPDTVESSKSRWVRAPRAGLLRV
ncbi:MAG: succinylglutamate desuccinylase/aspartoacylase family protein [Myxococcota bacterium]